MESIFGIIQRHWSRVPVPILEIIADAGIDYFETDLTKEVSGYIENRSGRYRIVVNAQHPHVRRRFTAAHELGHYALHRDLMGSGIGDNRVYRTAPGTPYYNPQIGAEEETQANKFAATVLMPEHLVKQVLPLPQRKSALAIAEAAEKLGVSDEALRIRLGLKRDKAA